jgi:hypothetical protein
MIKSLKVRLLLELSECQTKTDVWIKPSSAYAMRIVEVERRANTCSELKALGGYVPISNISIKKICKGIM